MANFGDILSGLSLGASQSVRRNAGNSAFEAFTPSTLIVGSSVSGGGANRVLYKDGSQNLAASANLTFDGNSLTAKSSSNSAVPFTIDGGAAPSTYLFRVGYNGNPAYFRIDQNGNISDIGGYNKRIQGASSGVYFPDGLVAATIPSAANSTAIFKTDHSGAYPFEFIATSGGAGRALVLVVDASQSVNVFEVADSSYNTKIAVDSNFNVVLGDGKNIASGTSTGTKIGTSTTQRLGFWNATPVRQPDSSTATAAFVAGSGTAVNDGSTFGGYTLKQLVGALQASGIIA